MKLCETFSQHEILLSTNSFIHITLPEYTSTGIPYIFSEVFQTADTRVVLNIWRNQTFIILGIHNRPHIDVLHEFAVTKLISSNDGIDAPLKIEARFNKIRFLTAN